MVDEKDRIRKQVEAEFATMERDITTSQPGILDVLAVYGNYEEAIRQASLYLNSLDPKPVFTTTDRSDF